MKTLSVKLPDALDTRVAAIARRRRMSKSALVRSALERLSAQRGQPRSGSALDLARDLAGCVSGPADLSVNKTHLKNFGR